MKIFTKALVAMLVIAVQLLYAQDGKNSKSDASLEKVSSEDLLKLKQDLEAQKSKLEGERLQLLDQGLKQSKDYLEKSSNTSSATTALVLLQRAEYLFDVSNDNFQVASDSIAAENNLRIMEWDRKKETLRQQMLAEGKKDADIEDAINQLPPVELLPDPERDFSEILKTYQELVDKFPESPYVVDAMYNIGFIKEQEGKQLKFRELSDPDANGRWAQEGDRKQKEALKVYQDLAVRFPDSKYAPEAYNRIGEYYFGRGGDADLQKAIKNYQKVLDYPQSTRFQEAIYKLAWTYYRLGDYPQAISYFTYLVDDVDSARTHNYEYQELDVEAIIYIGISFNRWAEQIDLAQGTNDGGYKLIKQYIDDAKLMEKRYAPDIMWQLAESYNVEQKDTLALSAYNTLLETYPLYWRAPDAQYKIVNTYERLTAQALDKGAAKSILDSVLTHRFKLYEAYKPNSEWSNAVADKEVVRRGNRMARDVLVDNILYFYGEAQTTNDMNNWKISMDYSKQFISYFPVDTIAYFFHYNLAYIQYHFFGLLDSAYEEYLKVANNYPYDQYRYRAAIDAYQIADSLYRMAPYKKPANAPGDSVIALSPGEEKLIDAINNYARLFPDTLSKYPVDSLDKEKPVMGVPGKQTPDFLAYAGEIYFNHNDYARANQFFNTVLTRYPNHPKAQLSQKYLMNAYYVRKDYRSSEIVARKIYENPNSSQEQKEEAVKTIFVSIFKHAQQFEERKESAKAAREFERAYSEGRQLNYAKVEDVSGALYNAGQQYQSSKELKRAIKVYETYVDTFPKQKFAPASAYNAHYLYAEMRDYRSAARTGERLADAYPDFNENNGALTAEIVLYNSEYYLEQAAKQATENGDSSNAKSLNYEAIRLSEKFVKRYPKSQYATDIDFGIANLYFMVNEEEKAFQKYREFANTYPTDKRNVKALYDIGMNHLRKSRRNEAIVAFNDAKKKSDELKNLKLDFNKYFASEAVYELAKIKYEDFSKIQLKLPNVDQKEDQKLTLVKDLIQLYEDITGYGQIRTYEATYYRGLVREEFGDALQNKEFKQEKDYVKQIIAQRDVYQGAAAAYRGAVDEYRNGWIFLDKAYNKFIEDEKKIADSIRAKYSNSADSADLVIKWTIEGKTAKDKDLSLAAAKELAIKYRDLAKSKISRILYATANSKKLVMDAFLAAPTTFEYGTPEYISEKLLGMKVISDAANDAIKAYEASVTEADSLGIDDKYTAECRRNIIRLTGIVPNELGKLAFTVMERYREQSTYYRTVVGGGENWVDPKTRKGFYDVFYDIPIEMNTYMSQYAQPIGQQAIKAYSAAVDNAKEKGMFNEDARVLQREMFNFAYEFAKLNYNEADTSDYYYKRYEATYYANESNDAFAYYSEASATYSQVITFARENAKGVLEEAYNSATDLNVITLEPDPEDPQQQVAKTNSIAAKRLLALLGKYDAYYAKLLKLKSVTKMYASNYTDWLSYNRTTESWQTSGFNDAGWYPAAAPPKDEIVPHYVLDKNEAYPMWLGLGQKFNTPKLPEPIEPKEEAPIDIPPVDSVQQGDSIKVDESTNDSTMSDSTQSFYNKARLAMAYVVQDSSVRKVYSDIEIQKILDTSRVVYFRTKFNIAGSPQGGKLYVASDGYYEFYMNGGFIGTALAEKEDAKGDSLEITDLFPENFIQGNNVLAFVLKDMESSKEHHGVRILLEVTEVEDATAEFAEPALPRNEVLKNMLFLRGRVVKAK